MIQNQKKIIRLDANGFSDFYHPNLPLPTFGKWENVDVIVALRIPMLIPKEFYCAEIELINDHYDKYRTVFSIPYTEVRYEPKNLQSHLMDWDGKLKEGIKKLGELNKAHFEKIGVDNKVICKVLKCMLHNYEKVGRWYKRFEESGWLTHDMHCVDDRLHDKIKAKEEKHNPY